MEHPNKCPICTHTFFGRDCPDCVIEEKEEREVEWCKCCDDWEVSEGDKYCQDCIEDHREMHKTGNCYNDCIICAEINACAENNPDAYDMQVDLGRKK